MQDSISERPTKEDEWTKLVTPNKAFLCPFIPLLFYHTWVTWVHSWQFPPSPNLYSGRPHTEVTSRQRLSSHFTRTWKTVATVRSEECVSGLTLLPEKYRCSLPLGPPFHTRVTSYLFPHLDFYLSVLVTSFLSFSSFYSDISLLTISRVFVCCFCYKSVAHRNAHVCTGVET